MPDPRVTGFGFVVLLAVALGGVAILINRRRARPGVVLIVLLMPFIYLFGVPLMQGQMPTALEGTSNALVVGVVAAVVGGLIVHAVTRK